MSSYIELLVYFSFPSFIVLPFYNSLLWSKEQLGTLRSLKNQDLSIWCGSPATPWGAYKVTEQPTTHILLRRLGHFLSFCHWLLDQSLLSLLAPRETMSLGLYTSGAQKSLCAVQHAGLGYFWATKNIEELLLIEGGRDPCVACSTMARYSTSSPHPLIVADLSPSPRHLWTNLGVKIMFLTKKMV